MSLISTKNGKSAYIPNKTELQLRLLRTTEGPISKVTVLEATR